MVAVQVNLELIATGPTAGNENTDVAMAPSGSTSRPGVEQRQLRFREQPLRPVDVEIEISSGSLNGQDALPVLRGERGHTRRQHENDRRRAVEQEHFRISQEKGEVHTL